MKSKMIKGFLYVCAAPFIVRPVQTTLAYAAKCNLSYFIHRVKSAVAHNH
jgi:hypothetical protein